MDHRRAVEARDVSDRRLHYVQQEKRKSYVVCNYELWRTRVRSGVLASFKSVIQSSTNKANNRATCQETSLVTVLFWIQLSYRKLLLSNTVNMRQNESSEVKKAFRFNLIPQPFKGFNSVRIFNNASKTPRPYEAEAVIKTWELRNF